MDTPIKPAEAMTDEAIDPEEAHLTPEQRELLRSFERALHQSETGQHRPAREFLEELRMMDEAEEHARRNGG